MDASFTDLTSKTLDKEQHQQRKSTPYTQVPQHESTIESRRSSSSSCRCFCLAKLKPVKGYIFAGLAAVFFSLSNILIRKGDMLAGCEHLSIFLALVLVLMFIVVVVVRRENVLGPSGQRLLLVARGLFGLVALNLLYVSLLLIPPSDCLAIANASLLVTAVLSRLFLKEKLGVAHVLALLLTVVGVLLIAKPSFLFPPQMLQATHANTANTTISRSSSTSSVSFIATESQFVVGITTIVVAAIFFGIVQVTIKKLCMNNVHWSMNTLYAAYVGLPVCLALSWALYWFEWTDRERFVDLRKRRDLLMSVAYSFMSAALAVLGSVALNLSFVYEDATKVSIAKSCDVLISFVLQMIILNISVDVLSVCGSVAILTGTCIVLSCRLLEYKFTTATTTNNNTKSKNNCFVKLLMLKF